MCSRRRRRISLMRSWAGGSSSMPHPSTNPVTALNFSLFLCPARDSCGEQLSGQQHLQGEGVEAGCCPRLGAPWRRSWCWSCCCWRGAADPVTKTKGAAPLVMIRSEEHTSELQSRENLVCRLLLEKKKSN